MKEYTSESVRNIALASHSSSGKTMLVEAFLHFTGATTRMGKIEDGTTASDFEEEEHRRGISLSTSLIPVEYKNLKINFLDTPGYTDFVGEVISALRVADGAMILVDSVAGAEVGTEIAMTYCDRYQLPRFVVINKMNRDNANFKKAVESVQGITATKVITVQLPMGEKADFKGVIDLLSQKAYAGDGKTAQPIPAQYAAEVEEARTAMIEAAAEGEDELLMKYLDGESLTDEEIMRGLRKIVQTGCGIPVFVAAGGAQIGLGPLLDAIVNLMPSPVEVPAAKAAGKSGEETLKCTDNGPFAAYVWKTTADPFVGKITYLRVYSGSIHADSRIWNQSKSIEERLGGLFLLRGKEQIGVKVAHAGDLVAVAKLSVTATTDTFCDKTHPLTMSAPEYPTALYSVAVFPKTQADSAKISPTLTRLCEEDPTLSWRQEHATNQTILQGMGDQHIGVAIHKAELKFQTFLTSVLPKVPYQEAITKVGQAMHRHKKQSGGAGQFAEVWMRVMPWADSDYEMSWDVVGGSISNSFMPAIDKGVRAVLKEGVVAGYAVHNVKVSIYDGKEHPVDSKPIAFETAGREAFKDAFKDANPVLREPLMNVRITVPEANMGDILGDLNTRRARVQGMDTDKGRSVVTATVPLAEMQRYTTDLRSMTGGRGIFAMEYAHYEVVPAHIAAEVIAARQKETQHTKED